MISYGFDGDRYPDFAVEVVHGTNHVAHRVRGTLNCPVKGLYFLLYVAGFPGLGRVLRDPLLPVRHQRFGDTPALIPGEFQPLPLDIAVQRMLRNLKQIPGNGGGPNPNRSVT